MPLIPLHYTAKGKGRVQIGVSWDVGEKWIKKGLIFKTDEKVKVTYDLDIFCCFYDADKNLLGSVTPENANLMGAGGAIYHSGDNRTGRIGGDDEFISVNMAELPDNIHAIIFVILCNGKDTNFTTVANVQTRIADGTTDADLLATEPSTLSGSNTDGYVFAAILKDQTQPQGWSMKNISTFINDADVQDWAETLKAYL